MKTLTLLTGSMLLVLPMVACDNSPKGEAQDLVDAVKKGDDLGTIGEEAGELAGAVTNTVGDKLDEAGEVVQDKAEKAGDKVDEAIRGDKK